MHRSIQFIRVRLITEARKIREKMIEEARGKANEEAQRIVDNALERIENEKMAAITELKTRSRFFPSRSPKAYQGGTLT